MGSRVAGAVDASGMEPGSLVTEAKTLRGIKERAERRDTRPLPSS